MVELQSSILPPGETAKSLVSKVIITVNAVHYKYSLFPLKRQLPVQMNWDLELDGSKYFGRKVQVLGVTSAAGQALNWPQKFNIAQGAHTRTNQHITVDSIAGGLQNINVQFRVIGDNGVVEEGVARCAIND